MDANDREVMLKLIEAVDRKLLISGLGSDRAVEQFTGLQHGMHDHGELARDRDGGPLKLTFSLSLRPQMRIALSAIVRVRTTTAAS